MPILGDITLIQNTEEAIRQRNAAINTARGLPRFQTRPEPQAEEVVLVGGGPSLADHVEHIRLRQRNGQQIWATNNTYGYLCDHGIRPDVHVLLDSRPENVAFLRPDPDVRYYVHQSCDPSLFEALKDCNVILYDLNGAGTGTTVGLKALYLAGFSGYRYFHLYGFDSSYRETAHHAYAQSLNNHENVIDVTVAASAVTALMYTFRCAPWMAVQAEEFQQIAASFAEQGCTIQVYGDGLLPTVARMMMSGGHTVARLPKPQPRATASPTPLIVTFAMQADTGGYPVMERARLVCRAIRAAMPHAAIVQLSNDTFEASPDVDEVLRMPYKGDFIEWAFTAMGLLCRRGTNVLQIATDVLLTQDVSDVFEQDFDVAACRYPDRADHAYCGDVTFIKPSGAGIWQDALIYYRAHPEIQDGWEGGQTAFLEVSKHYRMLDLDYEVYCKTPNRIDDDLSRAAIVHLRGQRKPWMPLLAHTEEV